MPPNELPKPRLKPLSIGGVLLIVLGLIIAVPAGFVMIEMIVDLATGPTSNNMAMVIAPPMIALSAMIAGVGIYMVWAPFFGRSAERVTATATGTPRRRWTAGAVATLLLGLMILVPSGLCTGVYATPIIYPYTDIDTTTQLVMLTEVLVMGAPFIITGLVLIGAGFRMRPKQ